MTKLPEAAKPYRRTPTFTETTVPAGLLKDHKTAAGVWGVINVLSGVLSFRRPDDPDAVLLTPGRPGIVEPEALHAVRPVGGVSFYVEFWRVRPA